MNELITLPNLHPIYLQVLDSLDVGIHIVNHEGISILYNSKMAEIEDMDKRDVLNKNIMDIFLFSSEEESRLLQALRKGTVRKNAKQTYFTFKGQEITTINNTFPLMHEGLIIGAVEIAKDITKLERLSRVSALDKQDTNYTFDQIVGESTAITEVIEGAKKATRTTSSVLIMGKTGTGKELFAQSIHSGSDRSSKAFISQNCAALPDTLIESILFGTVKGAFTGATEHPGLFEQANSGTLMLDEINSLSAPLQAKLLRAIQEKKIRRIGDTKDRKIDVRIIATINEDPLSAIEKNTLREDLYYRLSVVTVVVPTLKQRLDDIPLLVDHFIGKYNERFQLNVPGISEDVMNLFIQYDWPGNVRELEHIIEGAMNLINYDEEIDYTHLPTHVRTKFPLFEATKKPTATLVNHNSSDSKTLQEHMERVEKLYIEQSLKQHNNNITRAAKSLGLSRQSLQYRLKKLGLSSQ
ncbi:MULTISPECIES: sigma-54 interaction domain-containing protein [Bacillaceae]|uniref:Sigma 54-interacting transcriptional regulator n=1 Tax=Evansella alkalicola TaxID=745819 RepID=A0ABS6JYW3_9BACI|nr:MULTISPECIES: sigma 54-interacting transcriptional regulator [Bacillaceae]MBU9723784.1 sigma 54-interacting transcriptional regulator [Bacillus alkalicola]